MSLLARHLLIPEVVQTSAMDCGPAALKSLLDGFDLPVSYGELRDACQTDVDGTSIDTLEILARELGLEAEQIMLPADHLLLPQARALPAIVLMRHPIGGTHFVVVWRRHGGWLQIMDPAAGRSWLPCCHFVDWLYLHHHPVIASQWRAWAQSSDFAEPLAERLRELGPSKVIARRLIENACEDPAWRSLGALDASVRMVGALVRSGGLRRGGEAAAVCERLYRRAAQSDRDGIDSVPEEHWSVRPHETLSAGGPRLLMRGAVLVAVRGRSPQPQPHSPTRCSAATTDPAPAAESASDRRRLERSPGRTLLGLLRGDGLLHPMLLIAALLASSFGRIVEALLLRGLLDFVDELALASQRLLLLGIVVAFALGLLLVELPIASGLLRCGRRQEVRLRRELFAKLPRLGERYFASRLTSDLAQRSHALHRLRQLAGVGGQFLRAGSALLLTALGVVWLSPERAWLAVLIALAAVALPLLAQPLLVERDLRFRTLAGALSRHYLDALLGLLPIRSHAGGRALRREHETLLGAWRGAGFRLQSGLVLIQGLQLALTWGLAAWLLLDHLLKEGASGNSLLLIYWVLNLPRLGQEVSSLACQYPRHRNVTLRLLEPLSAPEEELGDESPAALTESSTEAARGVGILMRGVEVRAAGRPILEQVDLELEPGSQVAIVGPSGAGKSTLVGLLLGWRRPSAGDLRVDGSPLDLAGLVRLRASTAWIDPGVRLWNRSVADNLRYGASPSASLSRILDAAELDPVLNALPDGLSTALGEGGGRVSGGEGQQIRLARALGRREARLVVLDEPFRGLDYERRRRLLRRCRSWWAGATLLCVTHDVGDTLDFDRVLVVEQGRIVEQGEPRRLAALSSSRYRLLIDADLHARSTLWSDREWRRLWLDEGELKEERCSSVA